MLQKFGLQLTFVYGIVRSYLYFFVVLILTQINMHAINTHTRHYDLSVCTMYILDHLVGEVGEQFLLITNRSCVWIYGLDLICPTLPPGQS